MNVYNNISELPGFNKAVITIGTFDGLHDGHRKIISQLKEVAKSINGTTVVITFFPHPRHVLSNTENKVFILNTLEEKIALLRTEGIENLVIVPFTNEFSSMDAEAYISNFLINSFHPHTIIIGYDHRFGKNRTGNFELLKEGEKKYGYEVVEITAQQLNDIAISSTKIRQKLSEGDIIAANSLLGYAYFFSGKVVQGDQLGRTIGFPTANLEIAEQEKLIPGNGVYAVDVLIKDIKRKGMMNIGFRPTVGGIIRKIEVNIFDFNEDIYDQNITVFLKTKLRDEKKFNGLDELKIQLGNDAKEAMGI
jgi:riboflavin kinase / FMN adenylyltransferase